MKKIIIWNKFNVKYIQEKFIYTFPSYKKILFYKYKICIVYVLEIVLKKCLKKF